jgi:cobalt/nickel transport system permease protein
MVPVWVHAAKKVKEDLPKDKIPLVGVGAAFSFLAMMFNVPLVGGTTGHAVGGTLIALLFGPNAACIAVSVALLLQAVIFGDGGILAFGANCFNMAFVLPYVGCYIYNFIVDKFGKGKNGVRYVAAAIGSYIGINLAALCASIEFGLQPLLFTDSLGNALYCPYPLSVSIPAMMIPHLAVAGVVEAVFTVAVYAFVNKTSPDLVYENIRAGVEQTAEANKKHIPVFALVAVLVAATPLGLIATAPAWGEWGADEIAEVVTNGSALGYVPSGLANGWALESIMPDYSLEGMNEVAAYILSAVIGVALLVIIFKLISLTIKEKSKT